jgi:fructose-bisphosphate aldolase class II
MTIATLSDVLTPAMVKGYAVAGLVVLGWEDAVAYVEAAEEVGSPIILQAGPGFRKHMPIPVIGKMLRHLAEQSTVPIVIHIDHAYSIEECQEAADCGFSSLMFDGSMHPINKNIELTCKVVELAKRYNISVEGEVGTVGYTNGAESTMTDPNEASKFQRETLVDALAISIGNIHLQSHNSAKINYKLLSQIEKLTSIPLVLHGGSGIIASERIYLAKRTKVKKINVGTELRMSFGKAIRNYLTKNEAEFDKLKILSNAFLPVKEDTINLLRKFSA